MYIKDVVFREVKLNMPAPIQEGAVLTADGTLAAADGHDAFGILVERVDVIPPTGRAYVAVAGTIDLESPVNKDIVIPIEMQRALHDIKFIPGASGGGGVYYYAGFGIEISGGNTISAKPDVLTTIARLDSALQGVQAAGDDAFVYNTLPSQGLSGLADYDAGTRRKVKKLGSIVSLFLHAKGTAVSNAAGLTTIGQVGSGYRPDEKTPILAQIYNGISSESAPGYIESDGRLVLLCNAKHATSNYQVIVNAVYNGGN